MEKDRKFRALAIAAICIAVVGVSVAYAALAATLNINGTATVDTSNSWNVKFVNASSMTNKANIVVDGPSITSDQLVEWEATFTAPGQQISFTVDVQNAGSIDAVLTNITKTIEGAAKTVTLNAGEENEEEYEVFTYETKINNTSVEKVGDLSGTRLASTKSFTVTVTVTFDAAKKLGNTEFTGLNTKTATFKLGMEFGQAVGTEAEIA